MPVGQPSLRHRLRPGAFTWDQVALCWALAPMSRPETAEYLTHHPRLAGRRDTLFCDTPWPASQGVGGPRAHAAVSEVTAADRRQPRPTRHSGT